MLRGVGIGLVLGCAGCAGGEEEPRPAEPPIFRPVQPYAPTSALTRWWKGNPHAHSLWSTGEAPPEALVATYRRQGFHFLALTERNELPNSERWVPIHSKQAQYLEGLAWEFGRTWTNWRHVRTGAEGEELLLKTLPELRSHYERQGEFLLLDGQEIGDGTGLHPVDLVVLGAERQIEPRYGVDSLDRAERNLAGVREQAVAQIGTPLLAYLAHPNKGWTFTAADLVALRGTRFIEIVNGSAQANSFGDEAHPSVEALWDQANLERARSGAPLLFGIAGEDEFAMVFNEYDFWDYEPHPGNPWIAVRAQTLNSDELLLALQDGDFYGSTGLELEDVRFDGKALTVDTVDPSGLREFRTRFIGARRSRPEEGGVILLETREDPAVYTLTGDELFVRAQVISDFIPYDSDANVHACAWTQPVQPSLAAPEPR